MADFFSCVFILNNFFFASTSARLYSQFSKFQDGFVLRPAGNQFYLNNLTHIVIKGRNSPGQVGQAALDYRRLSAYFKPVPEQTLYVIVTSCCFYSVPCTLWFRLNQRFYKRRGVGGGLITSSILDLRSRLLIAR